jgi:hypothetical protein
MRTRCLHQEQHARTPRHAAAETKKDTEKETGKKEGKNVGARSEGVRSTATRQHDTTPHHSKPPVVPTAPKGGNEKKEKKGGVSSGGGVSPSRGVGVSVASSCQTSAFSPMRSARTRGSSSPTKVERMQRVEADDRKQAILRSADVC